VVEVVLVVFILETVVVEDLVVVVLVISLPALLELLTLVVEEEVLDTLAHQDLKFLVPEVLV